MTLHVRCLPLVSLCSICIATFALWLAAPALPDDGAVEGVGGALRAMGEHSSVVMESETVNVVISPKGADVHCVFIFRNDGPAAAVKMGFPEQGWGHGDVDHPSGFSWFRSWVDGQPVRTRIEGLRVNHRDGSWERWRTKVVHFASGQRRRVEVRYRDGIGGVSDGSRFFTYVMRTGASWKGKIGHAKVVITARGVKGYSTTDGGVFDGSKVVLEWRDHEPLEDVGVSFFPPAPPLKLNGRPLDYDLSAAPLPLLRGGDLIVPARWLANQIGAALSWDARDKSGFMRRGGTSVWITTNRAAESGKEVRGWIWHSGLTVSVADIIRAFGGAAELRYRPTRMVLTLAPQEGQRQSAGDGP
jgi:hypothetical protein